MGALENGGEKLPRVTAGANGHHLGAWNHHITDFHVRHFQRTFDNAEGVAVDYFTITSGADQFDQIFPGGWRAAKKLGNPVEPRSAVTTVGYLVCHDYSCDSDVFDEIGVGITQLAKNVCF